MPLPTFRIIPPVEIGDTELISSNVPETPPAAWSGATTYSTGQQVSIFSGASAAATTATVYQSLQNSNLNKNPASQPLWWEMIGTTYKAYSGATTYFTGDRVIDATTHRVYEALAGSTGTALTDTGTWVEVGATNKFAMFDNSNTTQSSTGLPITVEIAPPGRIDSVAMFNVNATEVTIVSEADGVEIYNESFGLTDTAGIDNWYDWFFSPVELLTEILVTDIPPYLNQTLTITIDNGSDAASVGTLIVGLKRDIGMTLAGAEAGIIDYSRKETNQWGDTVLDARAFAKKLNCTVTVDNDEVDRVQRLLTTYRATAVVWQAADELAMANGTVTGAAAMQLFGFYRSFSTAFSYPTQSVCTLELEGLT